MADPTPASTEAAPPAEKPAGKKSKLPLIIGAAVLALALAGGGAYFFLKKGADAEETEADADAGKHGKSSKEQGKNKDKDKKGKKGKEAAPKAPPVYVQFDPPFVVNFEAKGLMRFLQVSVQVMTRDPHTAELVKMHDPKLRNDLLMLLSSQTYETISTREGKEQLRAEALAAVTKVVVAEGGEADVEELYFTSFVMQ